MKIFEHTMVTEALQDNKITLQTNLGKTVMCKDVIFATHFPAIDPDNFYTNMRPEMSYALAFKADQEYPDGMYINADTPSRTFRKMTNGSDDYLLVGGQSHTIGDEHSEMERYEDIRQFAEKTFGTSDAIFRWSSHDLITSDRVPYIGQLHPQKSNMYTATGFSKWGLANAVTGAQLLKDLIANQENPYSGLYYPRRDIPDIRENVPEQKNMEEELAEAQTAATVENLTRQQATVIEKDDKKIGIYKDDDGALHHLDLACTHLGCDLNWNDGDQTWDCPCHGSRFTATGEVLEGPAKEPLAKANQK
ncbi:FAD-dependent oxidoreductase [Virgibacillus halophilus]|uniref:FAD-dependent oxidoreductase n=1 Tax=Tigheibacillus halophilus TaxID=361280 RepID=A0ABU5C3U6_9BACI|nr:FAD-dependent oxidoreductase [Virgibacillus halophilus]